MIDLHLQYRIGISTISEIIRDVCAAIWKNLREMCFPQLNEELWNKSASGFLERANFPNCLGAIDGKHFRVVKPTESGSLYYNYKHFFSILMVAICDANYKFLYIDVGSYGKSSDPTVFKNSTFHQKLKDGSLNIPPGKPLSQRLNIEVPHVLIADKAFGLSESVLTPYSGKFLDIRKRIYNYRLSRARRFIEYTFGILANKWRMFHRALDTDIELSELIIRTCCTLHNFVRERDGIQFEDTLSVPEVLDDVEVLGNHTGKASRIRNIFSTHFLSEEGEVQWQWNYV